MPTTRLQKKDENYIRPKDNLKTLNGNAQIKSNVLGDSHRSALGEVGNLVVDTLTTSTVINLKKENVEAKKGRTLVQPKREALGDVCNFLKNTDTGHRVSNTTKLKDIKPKVDTHWRKATVSNALPKVKRTNTDGTAKLVTTKTLVIAKPEIPKKVTFKSNAVVTTKPPIKRQESILTKRSISMLRQAISKQSSSEIETKTEAWSHSENLLRNIEDIDANDGENIMLVSEYVKDIYNYLSELEETHSIRQGYLDNQKEVNATMRDVLVDWINEVHLEFKLCPETYQMTVSLIDRYLQIVKTTARKHLQLVGITAMFLASKYEEMYPPTLCDFIFITDNTYNKNDIILMEMKMLKALDFDMSAPIALHFTRRLAKAVNNTPYNHQLSKYLVELSTVNHSMSHYAPSAIASSGVFISLKLCASSNKTNDEIWSPTMQYYSKYSLDDLRPIIAKLSKIALNAPKGKLQAVYKKYSLKSFEKIALKSELYGNVMNDLSNF